MSQHAELPKAYDAASVEADIFKAWEASGAFAPQGTGDPYSIVLPPPNRTGTLHLGHAMMLAIEDLLIRFHRMQGRKAYWVPGTDHAAISTQVKVEQMLMAQGMKDPRRELGREAFLEKVREFAQASRDTIVSQCKAMGSSMDWTREKYTLDAERSAAVNAMFKMMHEDELIERGFRVVNWDPQFKTTLSDDEVEMKETTARLLTFTYDAGFPIPISTTRPETKFGDTAVAVHPDDTRYRKFVGKTFTPTFCGKKLNILIVADEAVDPEFGTGAVGVTPAHSMIDAEIAERHGLPTVQVIAPDATMIRRRRGGVRRTHDRGRAEEDRGDAEDARRAEERGRGSAEPSHRPARWRHRGTASHEAVVRAREETVHASAGHAREVEERRHGHAEGAHAARGGVETDDDRAGSFREDLFSLDRQPPRLVHLAPDLVRASDTGLVQAR
jgi:valyl-tRNA synthetase